MFLTAEELQQLTGYMRRADQIRWLARKGIPHFINAKGDPVVARDTLTGQQRSTRYELGPVR